MTWKRVRKLRGHTAARRFGATLSPLGWLPALIMPAATPDFSSPTRRVWQDPRGRRVVVLETAHAVTEVFEVPAPYAVHPTEAAASDAQVRESRKRAGSYQFGAEYPSTVAMIWPGD